MFAIRMASNILLLYDLLLYIILSVARKNLSFFVIGIPDFSPLGF